MSKDTRDKIVTWLVEVRAHLPHVKLWVWFPAPHNQACNSGTREVEVGGSEVQGYLLLQNEFQASLGYYMRHCLSKRIKNKI